MTIALEHTFAPAHEIKCPTTPAAPMLSVREVQVLRHWLRCDSKQTVANELFISLGTINTHLSRIRVKYTAVGREASTKSALLARALQDGHITIDEL